MNKNEKFSNFFQLSLLVFIVSFAWTTSAPAQITSGKTRATYIDYPMTPDGKLDEPVWESADVTEEFWQYFPTDSLRAEYQTEIKILFDETTLYVGIIAYSSGPDYVVSSLRRDYLGTQNDNVTIMFDTFKDGTNAFFFGVTPYGVRREGQISDGGSNFNRTWDIKWQGESQKYDDRYVIEMAIPFTSLKFVEGDTSWRFRAFRWNVQTNEQSSSVRVPQNQRLSSVAFMEELEFDRPLGKSRTPFSLIPYINTIAEKDYETDENDLRYKIGGDAKVSIGNGMNLDITINPDFSNVEVDDIFTNLTRFELRLPEKRQFFIDNIDLFASFGNTYSEARPFFSRRIGLATDKEDNTIENPILAGVRLSGKLNEDWRLGFLNIQTDEDIPNEIPSNNNMMFVLQRKVFSRSNIGVFFINRETFQDYDFLDPEDKFNRVIGAEYNLASANNVWSGKFYVNKSFQPDDGSGNFSTQTQIEYNTRDYTFVTDLTFVDEEFRADLGFVPRNDILKHGIFGEKKFYPKSSKITRHALNFLVINYWRPTLDYQNTDRLYRPRWEADFQDRSSAAVGAAYNYIYLTEEFDPTGVDDAVPLPADTDYAFNQVTAEYNSNSTNRLTYNGSVTTGQFFNGNIFSAGAQVALRFQPWAQISLALNYDGIRLPDPYSDADIWLLSPRVEITFNKSLFWSTLIQYSNQRENLGINSRLQWRFAPLSDLFLVYNDNFYIDPVSPRYRSINLKVTYWINI